MFDASTKTETRFGLMIITEISHNKEKNYKIYKNYAVKCTDFSTKWKHK